MSDLADKALQQTISVRGLSLACQIWRPENPNKLLALHGWLDNSASFAKLAPLLTDYCVVAIDLAGQGLSEHRPPSSTYHLWDDVLDCVQVADQLAWQQFSVMGHSRGGMLASMLAAALPDRIERLYLLDGIMPLPVAIEHSATQLRRYVDDYITPKARHYFSDKESAIRFRAKASAIECDLAETLATRQLRQDEQGWYWHIDERLKAASAIKMTMERNAAFLSAIQCSVQVFIASSGMAKWPAIQQLKQDYTHFFWHEIDGHHHVHMTEKAQDIANLCAI